MPTDEEKDALRAELEAKRGEVFNTAELREKFEVVSFCYGMVVVVRKSDRAKGVMDFTHSPRLYFGFTPISQ